MNKVFCAPSRYTQGPRGTEQLGAEICALGLEGPAIIVAGGSAIRQLSDTWIKTFAAVKMCHAIFPFGGECMAAETRRGCKAAQEANRW
jgi:glycerol dehydrogenase